MVSAAPSLPALSTGPSAPTSMLSSPRSVSPGRKGEGDAEVKVKVVRQDADGDEYKEDRKEELVRDMKDQGATEVDATARAARLNFLLEKSTIYAKVIGDRMERQQIEKQKAEHRAEVRKANKEKRAAQTPETNLHGLREKKKEGAEGAEAGKDAQPQTQTGKRKRGKGDEGEGKKAKAEGANGVESKVEPDAQTNGDAAAREDGMDVDGDADADAEAEAEAADAKQYSFRQPELVTGATLRDYQLAGVQWMISLYENGLNGILADEMGLGKTLQTISFLAHLRAKGTWGPFLIVCPLSVLHNWITEFEKFCPTIPVLMYHGLPEHRAELRSTRMQLPTSAGLPAAPARGKKGGRKSRAPKVAGGAEGNSTQTFPIIVTTYEMCIKDRQWLSGYQWKFIVVDEGHRLKNLDCKLIRELKTYTSANRMILTGTPLHNNLAELWSLLNFILPDIFDDLDSFQQWFNFDEMNHSQSNASPNGESDPTAGLLNKSAVVTSLHAILKPFLLRRLKVDVEKSLPPKKEYLLYAPLTQMQKEGYQAIVGRRIREYLVGKKTGESSAGAGQAGTGEVGTNGETKVESAEAEGVEEQFGGKEGRARRRGGRKVNYKIEESDSKWLRDLEEGKVDEPSGVVEKSSEEVGHEWAVKQATKQVNNMRLQNIVMQLRKISSHPFLFDWPLDPDTGTEVVNQDLVNASGKMLLLNRLLDALLERGHKVLIFSQFTTMLDIIQDWAEEYKMLKICRIDGSTSQEARREQMHAFNNGGDAEDACKVFLLSTRAGGLGVNLVAADTVIFFDQDWNPQMDLQAQDRAHRIGQTRPVLIFRLVSAHTIETRILQKAGNKRKLEALVISQGKFGRMVDENGRVLLGKQAQGKKEKGGGMAEMARALLDLEGEEINVASKDDMIISDADLDILLDRSKDAMARKVGWSAGLGASGSGEERAARVKKGEKTAFEVFVPAKDEAADGLATMFGGDEEGAE